MQVAVEPFWCALKDEELLALRICDLGLQLEQSELKSRVDQLYEELAARGRRSQSRCRRESVGAATQREKPNECPQFIQLAATAGEPSGNNMKG